MNFASICRSLMIGVLAALSLALVLFGTNAYADHHLKPIAKYALSLTPFCSQLIDL